MRTGELGPSGQYIEELYAREDAGLAAVRARLEAAGRWGVNVGANEGRILQVLLRLAGARRAIEIGALFGYSTVWLARALPRDGRLFTLERDADCARMTRQALEECGVAGSVTVVEGEALRSLENLSKEGPFDFVFIDANKSAYPDYLDWSEKNVRPGGLIVADNVFLGGAAAQREKPASTSSKQWTAMRAFNERLADPRRFTSVILPTSEGLTVAIRNP